jgi:colanic acid/amylovoran biosynthesis glycosyltransferase
MLKIAFLVNQFPVLSETFILNQIIGLLDRGHEVDIYANERSNWSKVHPSIEQYNLLERTYYLHTMPENLPIQILKGIGLLFVIGYKNPLGVLKTLNIFKYGSQVLSLGLLYTIIPSLNKSYDIVHCQFGTQGYRGMLFRKINAPEAKLITTFRGYDISGFVRKKGINIYNKLFKTGDFFLANCEYFRQKAIEIGCDRNKILVHRSGLDCDRFIFIPRHFPSDDRIRIATTGRLVEKKGIEYVIRAVAKQLKITPNLEYNIIGDGELKAKLQQLIDELGVGQTVHLLGWKNEREIIEILNKSHIFIAPSITAKNGDRDAPINVLKEAMAMGLLVISTYHGGIPELVEDGVSGFLVPERDADAIAEKLNYIIEHPEQWETMGSSGRDRVGTSYNLDKLNDELVEIYQRILKTDLKQEQYNSLKQPIKNY